MTTRQPQSEPEIVSSSSSPPTEQSPSNGSPNTIEINDVFQHNEGAIEIVEGIFGQGVLSDFYKQVEKLLTDSSELDQTILERFRERIYQKIKEFLLALVNLLENNGLPTTEEIKNLIQALNLAYKWYPGHKPQLNSTDPNRFMALAQFKEIFFLSSQDNLDEIILPVLVLLNKVKRWLIVSPDQYAQSLLTDDFEESNLVHIIKMMLIFRHLQEIVNLTEEELEILGIVTILHDLPETVVGDFSQGENYKDSDTFVKILTLFRNIEALVFPTLLAQLKSNMTYQKFLELYQGYENRLQPKEVYNTEDLIYLLVRLLDKLDSLVTVITLEVLDPKELLQTPGYFDRGHSFYLEKSINNFLQTLEEYAQGAQKSEKFAGKQAELNTHLTNLIARIIQFLESQYNARLAKADKNKTVKITITNILELITQILGDNRNRFVTIRPFVIQTISSLNPEDPYDKVIKWLGY